MARVDLRRSRQWGPPRAQFRVVCRARRRWRWRAHLAPTSSSSNLHHCSPSSPPSSTGSPDDAITGSSSPTSGRTRPSRWGCCRTARCGEPCTGSSASRYRHAELIAPVTHAQVRALRTDKGVPADRLHLVRNGVDLELFAPGAPTPEVRELLSPNGERVIIFAGTLGYAQGLDVILDAAPVVRAADPDARFVLVGAGSDTARVRGRVEAEAIAGVDVLPPRPLAQIAELYKGAFAGLTSLRASPVFEAARPSKIFPMMAAGLPIVYSGRGRGSGSDRVRWRGCGRRARGSGCAGARRHRAARRTRCGCGDGHNGRRLVEADLSWSQIMEEFIDHLEWRIGVDRMH